MTDEPERTRWNNPFPDTKPEEVTGTREEIATRYVIVRHIGGIPVRGYLIGSNDHAPIVAGVRDLVTAAYAVLDSLADRFEDSSEADALAALRAILEPPHAHP